MSLPQRFEVERSARLLFTASSCFFAALALSCAILPLFPYDGKDRNEVAVVALAIFGCSVSGLAFWYAFRVVRKLPEAAITIDEDGLWPTFKDKDSALVKWSDIVRLRERDILQRLDVLDASGKVVANLEYQLRDFQRLRRITLERASLTSSVVSGAGVHQKPLFYHLLNLGIMMGFALLGRYVGPASPLLGYGGVPLVVALIAWEYWNTPFRIRIAHDALEVDWPARRKTVPWECIAGVDVEDVFIKGSRIPHVNVRLLDGSNSIHLQGLGLQAVELHQILQAWRRGDI